MYVTHSSVNGVEVEAQPLESSADPNADLFGDWSWKPDRYPTDPGKVYTEAQIQALYPDGLVYGAPSIHHAAIFGADYTGIAPRPPRIGPHIG